MAKEPVEFVLHDLHHRVGSLGVVSDEVLRRLESSPLATLRQVLPAPEADQPRLQAAHALLDVLDEERHRQVADVTLMRLQVQHLRYVLRRSLLGPVDAVLSLRDVVEEAVALAGLDPASVRVVVPTVPLPPWIGDRWTLLRVLLALLDNAREALGRQGQPGTITITIAIEGDRTSLQVTDTGCGWSPEQAPRRQGDRMVSGKGGSGLGLVSCLERVRMLRGTLHWSSPGAGLGATFCLELPGGSP